MCKKIRAVREDSSIFFVSTGGGDSHYHIFEFGTNIQKVMKKFSKNFASPSWRGIFASKSKNIQSHESKK